MRWRRAELSCGALRKWFSQQTALPLAKSINKFVFVEENLRISCEVGNAHLSI
jgi:hypothetical protein